MHTHQPKSHIKSEFEFERYIEKNSYFKNIIIQNIDFTKYTVDWSSFSFKNTIFMNCEFSKEDTLYLMKEEVFIYPKFQNLPYHPSRVSLYNWQELLNKDEKSALTKDEIIYEHFYSTRFNPSMNEALAQRIHDYSIDNLLRELLSFDNEGMTQKKAVGFMGGHSASRKSEFYIKTAIAAKLLAEDGYYIVTGGGPGIMEAANFGAYMAGYSKNDFNDALALLGSIHLKDKNVLEYQDQSYTELALEVLKRYPKGTDSLAIPTWLYGHEPSNLFASHIAKYFANSIREDMLLAICLYGVVYAPGSAGTTQEIFQEATQNHYGTYGYHSPMIFLSKKRYVEDTALYSTLHQLSKGMKYKELLFLTDNPHEVYEFIKKHPPIKKMD